MIKRSTKGFMCGSFAISGDNGLRERSEGPSRDAILPQNTSCKTIVRRVLVMDDDQITGEIIGRILAARGYRVLLSETGIEAINAYNKGKACGEPFDVVILDLHVPAGMNGKETLRKLLEIDPQVKAVITSGDVTDPGMTNFWEFGFKDALAKPFVPTELEKVLSSLAPLAD